MLKYLNSAVLTALISGQAAMADPHAAFDVAEDHTRIVTAAESVHEIGMPAHDLKELRI